MTGVFAPIPEADLGPDAAALRGEILSTRAAVVDAIGLRGPQGTLRGPFDPLLRTPKIGDAVQRLGLLVRAASDLPADACAVCVLTVVHTLGCEFEWQAHSRLATANGVLGDATITAIQNGESPEGLMGTVWEFSRQQVRHGEVRESLVDRALAAFGERGVVELTVLVGYYQIISLLMGTCAPRPTASQRTSSH